ncbi:MAG: tRNA (adenosine(37)-N6)-threonylcarbamoyltransferase complex dimerization subunit type 1 TsaB, partial [Dehalococcoidia bacterium]|nr:tRNA (adenosine(37)-N6)-threonylcarbamoyltransferase complex dimerization subunit type 1 TsaB [Dehalococcoidia bacterium]
MQLAIDTSTETATIALVDDGRLVAELTWCCGEFHTVELLPNLSHLLKLSAISIEKVSSVVVATGPGSFNGLRVG